MPLTKTIHRITSNRPCRIVAAVFAAKDPLGNGWNVTSSYVFVVS